jgi:hypothetical protein
LERNARLLRRVERIFPFVAAALLAAGLVRRGSRRLVSLAQRVGRITPSRS